MKVHNINSFKQKLNSLSLSLKLQFLPLLPRYISSGCLPGPREPCSCFLLLRLLICKIICPTYLCRVFIFFWFSQIKLLFIEKLLSTDVWPWHEVSKTFTCFHAVFFIISIISNWWESLNRIITCFKIQNTTKFH